ncbi:hypothetical protein EVAR_81325_1 [Eumeta japonica]|uniref:Uncharacterized protein n=1 Tax=Eumeta variegata TaxID=151549 RepID=A0A4C1W1P0_EUMVA|nr:hypothetical protein EVAR_81325_1 [Eumeta japonica]
MESKPAIKAGIGYNVHCFDAVLRTKNLRYRDERRKKNADHLRWSCFIRLRASGQTEYIIYDSVLIDGDAVLGREITMFSAHTRICLCTFCKDLAPRRGRARRPRSAAVGGSAPALRFVTL